MGGGLDTERVMRGERSGRDVAGDVAAAEPRPGPGPRPGLRSVDLVLVAVTLLGIGLRLWGVTGKYLWFDEWSTARAARGSPGDLLLYLRGGDGLPPPYFMGMWVWTHLLGNSVLALRLSSVVAGVATIPAMYAAAQALGLTRRVARVAALLTAVHPMLIWYSQEVRSYSPLVLCATLSLWAYGRARTTDAAGEDAEDHRRAWLLWGLAALATVSMHYLGALLIAAEAVDLWRRLPGQRDRLQRALRPVAVLLALLVPYAFLQRSNFNAQDWVADFPLRDRLYDVAVNTLVGPVPSDGRMWLVVLAAVVLAGVLLATRIGPTERATAGLLALFVAATMVAVLAATVVGIDAVLSRYLIAGLAPLILVVAIGLGDRRAGPLGYIGVAVVVAVAIPVTVQARSEPDLQKPDWEAVADVLDAGPGSADGARVVVASYSGYLALPLLDRLDDAKEITGKHRARDVTEVDIIFGKGTDHPCNLFVGIACSMGFLGALPPQPALDELFLVERIELDQFAIERYGVRDSGTDFTRRDLLQPDLRKIGKVIVWNDPKQAEDEDDDD